MLLLHMAMSHVPSLDGCTDVNVFLLVYNQSLTHSLSQIMRFFCLRMIVTVACGADTRAMHFLKHPSTAQTRVANQGEARSQESVARRSRRCLSIN